MEQELRDQDRKKDDFIALLATNCATPWPRSATASSDAPGRRGRQEVQDTRESMDRQLTHMVRLIDDLLDISRINRNKMDLRLARVTLAEVVKSAAETARPLIESGARPDRPLPDDRSSLRPT